MAPDRLDGRAGVRGISYAMKVFLTGIALVSGFVMLGLAVMIYALARI